MAKYVDGLQAPDYSTICRRVNRLSLSLEDTLIKSSSPATIAIDASGVKVHNGGDWIRRCGVKKGYLKIHYAVNTKTKQILSIGIL